MGDVQPVRCIIHKLIQCPKDVQTTAFKGAGDLRSSAACINALLKHPQRKCSGAGGEVLKYPALSLHRGILLELGGMGLDRMQLVGGGRVCWLGFSLNESVCWLGLSLDESLSMTSALQVPLTLFSPLSAIH